MVALPASPLSLASPPLVTHPQKVIVMGDSLVYGFGDSEGGGWVDRLRRRWMNPDCPGPILYNLGVRGDTVEQVKQRLDGEFRLRGELRRRIPDVLILSVGLNDAARLGRSTGRLMTDEHTFSEQLDELLTQAKALACPVFFIGMVPVNEAAMPYANTLYFSQADQARFKGITQRACATYQIPYLDLYEQWINRGQSWCLQRLCSDGIHPNVLGYQTLLNDILDWQPLIDELVTWGL
jgi:lysophospholipase L1-like esterase